MCSATLSRMAILLTLFGLTATTTPAQQSSSQSQTGDAVADAARRSREQKKTEAPPKKVYTDDDFASTRQAPASDAAKSDAPAKEAAAGTEAADKPGAEEDKNGEAYWRKRFKKAHDKLATAEKELDILQREQDKDQVQYYNDPQKALMQQYNRSDINEKNAKIDAKKKEIEALKQELANMEDELRKAGGDSGWAR
jgi:hypothetical protein